MFQARFKKGDLVQLSPHRKNGKYMDSVIGNQVGVVAEIETMKVFNSDAIIYTVYFAKTQQYHRIPLSWLKHVDA